MHEIACMYSQNAPQKSVSFIFGIVHYRHTHGHQHMVPLHEPRQHVEKLNLN